MNTSTSHNKYPAPLAKYEDVVVNRQLFMTTLEQLHTTMGTKFMVPIIGGRDLDLHKLFVEVTSRGGIEKILSEKRWKDVTSTFSFPSTATNASFVLRKYYYSLLQHYERIYYLKAQGVLQGASAALVSDHGSSKRAAEPSSAQPTNVQQPSVNNIETASGAPRTPAVGFPVIGVIDGKFDSGYLVTVTIGKEKLKGVLYQTPPATQVPQSSVSTGKTDSTPATSGLCRKRRRKKSEIRRRDPAQPKPNRSGYNFFFAEQHARLKALHPGKDRDISRMIGELWNNLEENNKAVYQEMAMKDKERYKVEMEEYRERLRANQVISDAVPIKQRFPGLEVELVEVNTKDESNSSKSETYEEEEDDEEEEAEDDDEEEEDFIDAEPLSVACYTAVKPGNAGTSETSAAKATEITGDFQVVTAEEKSACEESEGSLGDGSSHHAEAKQDLAPNVEHENQMSD